MKIKLFLLPILFIIESSCSYPKVRKTHFPNSHHPIVRKEGVKIKESNDGKIRQEIIYRNWHERNVVCGGSYVEKRIITYDKGRKIKSDSLIAFFSSAWNFNIEKTIIVTTYEAGGKQVKKEKFTQTGDGDKNILYIKMK